MPRSRRPRLIPNLFSRLSISKDNPLPVGVVRRLLPACVIETKAKERNHNPPRNRNASNGLKKSKASNSNLFRKSNQLESLLALPAVSRDLGATFP